MLLAVLYLNQRRSSEAIVELQAVVAQDSRFPSAQNLLGTALYATDRLADARSAFEAALAQDPTDGAAAIGLGRLYASQGKYPEAIELLERAKELTKEAFPDQEMLDYLHKQVANTPP